MASIKAIAAIALTLMIAVPIGLGYAFASTEETTTYWQTDSTANATELLLNYNSEYTAEYMNPQNNKELLIYDGSSYSIASPNYSSITSTYTSLPEYTTSTGTISLGSSTTQTFTNPTINETFGTSTADNTIGKYPMTYIHFNREGALDAAKISDYGSQEISFTFGNIYLLQDSGTTWNLVNKVGSAFIEHPEWASEWLVTITSSSSVNNNLVITTRDYTQIDPGIGSDFSFSTSDCCSLKIVTSDATTYLAIPEVTSVLVTTSGTVTLGGTDVYENVTGLYIAEQPSVSSITYTYTGALSGNYADPAEGWDLPAAATTWWLNAQQNETVRFMVHLDSGENCLFRPATTLVSSSVLGLSYDGSSLTVSDYTASVNTDLGNYSDAMVVFTMEGATVYGLSSWPTLGVWPNTFNQVYIDYDDISEPFRYVYLSGNASFRVDLAEIVAGTYPSTKDLTLALRDKYPDTSLVFTIKSVAKYGDKLNIVYEDNGSWIGIQFEVTDGTITVDGETVKVRGLQYKFIKESDSTWSVYIDDKLVIDGLADSPNLDIWGEWSLTASVGILKETTTTQQVWAPGEFAFDKEDFAACGLLVAGACLVGLGMTGSRSGIKMGVLLMICGGAGLIYLTLI